MKSLPRHIITTSDGSNSLYVPELNEHYHSIHGAIQESQHVFIDAGLKSFPQKTDISILEIGFGTGLNALLTLDYAAQNNLNVAYSTIEKYPLTEEEYLCLNYATGKLQMHSKEFLLMHQSPWEVFVEINSCFTLQKIQGDLLEKLPAGNFNLIYFDAFAPDKQPMLWEKPVFEKIFDQVLPGGKLVTYCAKGQVRRNLQQAGFLVERIPGPPGKREMLRATKPG